MVSSSVAGEHGKERGECCRLLCFAGDSRATIEQLIPLERIGLVAPLGRCPGGRGAFPTRRRRRALLAGRAGAPGRAAGLRCWRAQGSPARKVGEQCYVMTETSPRLPAFKPHRRSASRNESVTSGLRSRLSVSSMLGGGKRNSGRAMCPSSRHSGPRQHSIAATTWSFKSRPLPRTDHPCCTCGRRLNPW